MANVAGVELARVAHPLQAALRFAFVAVIAAAVLVDSWVNGDLWALSRREITPTMLIVVCVAVVGVAWAVIPDAALLLAPVAAALSLIETVGGSHDGIRIVMFTELVVLPVLFAASLTKAVSIRWPVAALVVVAGCAIALRTSTTPIRAIIAMSMAVLFGAAGSAIVYIRLRDSERRTSIENARFNERLDLARELHDVVGHHVTGIVVLAQASRFTNGAERGSPADRALEEIEAAGLETITSVRRLVGLLRTDPTTSSGARLVDIEQIIEDLRTTHESTDLVIDDSIRAQWITPDLANTVQRLVQEGATNIRRHGDPARRSTFTIARSADGRSLCLGIENTMLHAPADAGFGLTGMRERVDALAGRFDAGPTPDGRWVVAAELPVLEHAE